MKYIQKYLFGNMICYILFCLAAFLYEAAGRPPSENESSSRSPPLDQFAILRLCRRSQSNGSSNCRLMAKRWYYDSSAQMCRPFAWTGCGGNDNRFDTREACENQCGGVLPCRPSRPPPIHEGCTIFRAIDINDGCPVYHWDCQDKPRKGSCPPAIDIGPLPKDCSISTIRTYAGCSKDIVTCS